MQIVIAIASPELRQDKQAGKRILIIWPKRQVGPFVYSKTANFADYFIELACLLGEGEGVFIFFISDFVFSEGSMPNFVDSALEQRK